MVGGSRGHLIVDDLITAQFRDISGLSAESPDPRPGVFVRKECINGYARSFVFFFRQQGHRHPDPDPSRTSLRHPNRGT